MEEGVHRNLKFIQGHPHLFLEYVTFFFYVAFERRSLLVNHGDVLIDISYSRLSLSKMKDQY
jgi:hypothetical protein